MIKIDAKGGVVRGKAGEANRPSHEGSYNLSWGVGTLCQDAESRVLHKICIGKDIDVSAPEKEWKRQGWRW